MLSKLLIGVMMMGVLSWLFGCTEQTGWTEEKAIVAKQRTEARYVNEPDVLLPLADECSDQLQQELKHIAMVKEQYGNSEGFTRSLQRGAIVRETFRQQCGADDSVLWYECNGYPTGGRGPWRIVEVRQGRLVRYDLHFGLIGKSKALKSSEPTYTEFGTIEAEVALAELIDFAQTPEATWLR